VKREVPETVEELSPVGPYSQVVNVGDLYFFSGQLPLQPGGAGMETGSISNQTRRVMDNIGLLLRGAGLDYNDIAKTTIFTTDLSHFADINRVYAEYFVEAPPARSCIQVGALPLGAAVEIEVIAVRQV